MPTISCILATKDRSHFLSLAIDYFLAQTFRDAELIIIDDSAEPNDEMIPINDSIKYLHLREPMSLGRKLNAGIALASGTIIQKLDDDDYYHPRFLEVISTTFLAHPNAVVAIGSLIVLILSTGDLHDAGTGWFAGSTYCFSKEAWTRCGFRDVPRRVDVYFLEDHPELERIPVHEAGLHVVVRHASHTWTRLVPEIVLPKLEGETCDVNAYLASFPHLGCSMEDYFGQGLARRYRMLMGTQR